MCRGSYSYVEMLQESFSLGFVAVAGTVNEADEGPIYSPSMVELLQAESIEFIPTSFNQNY
jgi:hypothetical protein